ncbi:MAG: hypothetical protein RLZZ210_559 [Pseudomonadota bacterium]|jgi:hypothetical protein
MTITISYKKPALDSHYRRENDKESYTKRQRLNTQQQFIYHMSVKPLSSLSYNPKESTWSNGSTSINLNDAKLGSLMCPSEIHLDLSGMVGLDNPEKSEFVGIIKSLENRIMLPSIKITGGGSAHASDIESVANSIVSLQDKKPEAKVTLSKEFVSKLNEQFGIPKPSWKFENGKLSQEATK